jgi:hypothetical protein
MSSETTASPPVTESATRVLSRPRVAGIDADNDWLCAWCLSPVARETDRFFYDGRSEFAFTNPAGIPFQVITFSQTIGCRETGRPTLAYTWFPGHAWSFSCCAGCGVHLGWFYSGPHQFAGLIYTHLVRAAAALS